MTTWKLTVEAKQPISIASQVTAESQWQTTSYIPGTTLRGAIAQQWQYEGGFSSEQLTEQFLTQCKFYDAYPEGTSFIPIQYKRMKTAGHAINLLKEYVTTRTYLSTYKEETLVEPWSPYDANVIESTAIGIKISAERESTIDGGIYSMTSIAQGTVFTTTVQMPEQIVEQLAPNGQATVYIGKKRFSGYGEALVTFSKEEQSYEDVTFIERDDQIVLALTSKSPIQLYDAFLKPATSIVWEEHIAPLLDETLQQLRPIEEETWGYSKMRDGWQQLWNMPKPTAQLLEAGTTYIVTFAKNDEKSVRQAVEVILQQGIGERTAEGFGQFIVAPLEHMMNTFETADETVNIHKLHERFSADEEAAILSKAVELVKKLTNDKWKDKENKPLSKSQWHNLLMKEDLIEAIISEEPTSYLEERLRSPITNTWNIDVKTNRKMVKAVKFIKGKELIQAHENTRGELLRAAIQSLIKQYNDEATKQQAARLFISFCARHYRMDEKGVNFIGK